MKAPRPLLLGVSSFAAQCAAVLFLCTMRELRGVLCGLPQMLATNMAEVQEQLLNLRRHVYYQINEVLRWVWMEEFEELGGGTGRGARHQRKKRSGSRAGTDWERFTGTANRGFGAACQGSRHGSAVHALLPVCGARLGWRGRPSRQQRAGAASCLLTAPPPLLRSCHPSLAALSQASGGEAGAAQGGPGPAGPPPGLHPGARALTLCGPAAGGAQAPAGPARPCAGGGAGPVPAGAGAGQQACRPAACPPAAAAATRWGTGAPATIVRGPHILSAAAAAASCSSSCSSSWV